MGYRLTEEQKKLQQRGLCVYTPLEITGEIRCSKDYECLTTNNPTREEIEYLAEKLHISIKN